MTPSGRTHGKSPPLFGTTMPLMPGPCTVPSSRYTAARSEPYCVGRTQYALPRLMEIVRAYSSAGGAGTGSLIGCLRGDSHQPSSDDSTLREMGLNPAGRIAHLRERRDYRCWSAPRRTF